MTGYIIKSILCSGLLLMLYHFFLEQEKMHRFNRFYLLFSIVISTAIPLLTIEMQTDILPEPPTNPIPFAQFSERAPLVQTTDSPELATQENKLNTHWPFVLYGLICIILLARLSRNFRAVMATKSNRKVVGFHSAQIILLPQDVVTYTFLNNIFVSESAFSKNEIEDEVLTHELAHVRQKHTLDVLFIELLRALFWINPLWSFYKKAIQLNHEFLADEAVLNTFPNVKNYQLLLLDKTIHLRQIDLTSSFTFSITKKRLAMMTKSTSRTRRILKKAAVAVFSLGLAFTFSDRIYSQGQSKTSQGPLNKKSAVDEKSKSPGKKLDSRPVSDDTINSVNTSSGPGISQDLIEEFNTSVKIYTKFETASNGKSYATFRQMPIATKQHLYKLYSQMTRQQQDKTQLTFFESPIPVKSPPSNEVFESWKDKNVFGVWIDNKKVSNTALDKYQASDIAEWWSSKLYANARRGKIYKYQLDLTTNQEFDRTFDARVNDRIVIGVKDFLQK